MGESASIRKCVHVGACACKCACGRGLCVRTIARMFMLTDEHVHACLRVNARVCIYASVPMSERMYECAGKDACI